MAVTEGVLEGVHELLAEFGAFQVRRMFGGAGLYRDKLMFGLVVGDDLYLKTDPLNRSAFEAAGSEPFTFAAKAGRTSVTSYWRMPAAGLDDPLQARRWAELGLEAALRASKPKGRKPAAHDLGPGPWDP